MSSKLECPLVRAPLFPLPNLIFFPRTYLPLNIFEPRYRQLFADTLRQDRVVAMALLKPGTDPGAKRAPINRMVCLGRIIADRKLPDGRYHVVLRGLSRARVIKEESTDKPYRVASLRLCADSYKTAADVNGKPQQYAILDRASRLFPNLDFNRLLSHREQEDLPLGAVCDVLAWAVTSDPLEAQQLLETTNVDDRYRMLLNQLDRLCCCQRSPARQDQFPPRFSVN